MRKARTSQALEPSLPAACFPTKKAETMGLASCCKQVGDLLEAACEQGLHDTVLPDLLELLAALLEYDRAAIAEGCEGAHEPVVALPLHG
jgi:hypothetical protein